MTTDTPTRDAIVAEARRLLDRWGEAITRDQALLLAAAELSGDGLDVFDFDDAATLLRAERLFVEGLGITDALATARHELVAFASGTDVP